MLNMLLLKAVHFERHLYTCTENLLATSTTRYKKLGNLITVARARALSNIFNKKTLCASIQTPTYKFLGHPDTQLLPQLPQTSVIGTGYY